MHHNYERKTKILRILTTLDDSFDWCEFKTNCISVEMQNEKKKNSFKKKNTHKKKKIKLRARMHTINSNKTKTKTKPKNLNHLKFWQRIENVRVQFELYDKLPFALRQSAKDFLVCFLFILFSCSACTHTVWHTLWTNEQNEDSHKCSFLTISHLNFILGSYSFIKLVWVGSFHLAHSVLKQRW